MTTGDDDTQRPRPRPRARFAAARAEISAPAPAPGPRLARQASITIEHLPFAAGAVTTIDWDGDVLHPTERLLEAATTTQVPLTLMVDMGVHAQLAAHDPDLATAVADQWRAALADGHDVQLSLRSPHAGGNANPAELIAEWRRRLERELRGASAEYAVVAARVTDGAVLPYEELYDTLTDAGIHCDSSVRHGYHGPGADFRFAYSRHQAYFASRSDPQLKAPPAESALVELPVVTFASESLWTFGDGQRARLDDALIALIDEQATNRGGWPRTRRAVRVVATAAYLRAPRRLANRAIPRAAAWRLLRYGPERLMAIDVYVLAAAAARAVSITALIDAVRRLQREADVDFVTLSQLATTARQELAATDRGTVLDEHERQISQNYANVMGTKRNDLQSLSLQELVPASARKVLDLGCGTGDWSRRIADYRPGCEVIGVDIGDDFIERAREVFGNKRVTFRVEDFAGLSFADETFDCVYADNSLEHAYDVDQALREVHRVIAEGGVLVAALPSDARNPSCTNTSHTWKTAPHDVRRRVARAGFTDIEVTERDGYAEFEMAPYPPSRDLIVFVRATRRRAGP